MALNSDVLFIIVVGGVSTTCLVVVIGYLYWQISTLGTYLKVEQRRKTERNAENERMLSLLVSALLFLIDMFF